MRSNTLSLLGATTQYAGSLLTAHGNAMAADSQAQQLRWQADHYRHQALLAEIRGRLKIRASRRQQKFAIGKMVRGYARGGVQLSGSALVRMQDEIRERAFERHWLGQEAAMVAAQKRAAARQASSRADDMIRANNIRNAADMMAASLRYASILGQGTKEAFRRDKRDYVRGGQLASPTTYQPYEADVWKHHPTPWGPS